MYLRALHICQAVRGFFRQFQRLRDRGSWKHFIATGSTVLRYTDSQFIFNWKTPSGAGKCYRVTMTAQYGSTLVAYLKMK
jgi:hypothetical protein